MKLNNSIAIAVLLIITSVALSDDLNKNKIEKATKDILDVFVNNEISEKSDYLRKYISDEWLEKKRIDVKKYKINNYAPEFYNVVYTGGDVCIAIIGGKSWTHLLVFKFIEEGSAYHVVPKGISEASNNYIDPWYFVKDYLCSEKEEK